MAKQQPKRTKHIPQRTCIGCRTVLAKKGLIRIVRTPEGVMVDLTGKAPGRGAYIHGVRSCWQAALKGPIAHTLKTELSAEDRQRLTEYLQTLPAETVSEETAANAEDKSGAQP